MIVHVPFAYDAEVIPKNARRPVERRFLSVVPVEIRELTAEAAPLAFRTADPETLSGTRIIELHSFNNKLWRPIFTSRDADDTPAMTLQNIATSTVPASLARLTTIDDPNAIITRIVSSQRDETAAKIVANWSNMIAIDGVMHEPCPEPVYVLRGTYEKYVAVDWSNDASAPDKLPDVTYGAEEFSLIEKRGDLCAGDYWRPQNLIEILDPTAPSRRFYRIAARQVAEEVKNLCVSSLANRDRDFFDLFATIRDELAEDVVDPSRFIDLARKVARLQKLDRFWLSRIDNATERVQYAEAELALADLGDSAPPRR